MEKAQTKLSQNQKPKSYLDYVRGLPEKKRKVIFWLAVIIIGISLFLGWVKSLEMKIKSFRTEKIKEELKIPRLEEELKGLQKLEMPETSQEELKKIEELIKESLTSSE